MIAAALRAIRSACRRLLTRPGHSLLSITVLGAGLGVVLFLFSLVQALILRPLPFPDADRLVAIGHEHENDVGIGSMASDEYLLLAPRLRTVDTIGGYEPVGLSVSTGEGATHFSGTRLTANMLSLLGVRPILGRAFTADDDRNGAELTVMLGERTWRNAFAGDRSIVGRRVRVNGEWGKVIGVMPAGFAFPVDSDVWVPRRAALDDHADIEMVARLRSDTGLDAARAELASVASALGDSLRVQQQGRHVVMKPLALSFVNEKMRRYVWVMFFAGALVLLLACANVANLLLVQTLTRHRELSIRSALGATRWRLLCEQLAESFVLSALATLIALAIAQFGNRWLEWVYAANGRAPHYFIHLGVDGGVIAFAVGATLLTTMIAGLLPAWRASRADMQQALRDGGGGTSSGFARVAKLLVVAEIMLTVVLLVGAGTFLHGLVRLIGVPTGSGTDPAHVLIAKVEPFAQAYPDAGSRARLFDQLTETLRRQPGVVEATTTNTVPGAALGSHEFVGAEGSARPREGWTRVQQGIVDRQFAQTFNVRVLQGRFFAASDVAGTQPVAVIDQTLALSLWPDGNPIGRHLVLNPDEPQPSALTVIGVVAPLMLDSPTEDSLPSLLRVRTQAPLAGAMLAIRTQGAADGFASHLRAATQMIDPQLPVYAVQTQARAMTRSRVSAVVLTQVFSSVATIALILAGAGLYGVLSFSVFQRTREIGVRRAIGASDGAIVGNVGRQLLLQIGLGLGLGLLLAAPWSRLLADPKMQTQGLEPVVFIPVVSIILGVAVLAMLVPLWRALRVDPVVALRHD